MNDKERQFLDWQNALRDLLHVELSPMDTVMILATNEEKLKEHFNNEDEPERVAMLILRSVMELDR